MHHFTVGACLSHVESDGNERPVCYISRVLNKTEQNYSITHKEGLSVVWAVKKLYHFLAGRHFEIVSDHKALEVLFGENKSLPQMAAGRVQRWSLFLSNFDYTFRYIKSSENVKADALSRLPVQMTIKNSEEFDYVNFVEGLNVVDINRVRSETRKDVILGKVYNLIRYGFEKEYEDDTLKPFYGRKDELSLNKGVIMWGYRVVVPFTLRKQLLQELHANHEGIVKMKTRARSYFWWPSLDGDIEKVVKTCEICIKQRPEPSKSFSNSWIRTNKPLQRVHADFLGPFMGKTVLVIIDSYSKWPEAYVMNKSGDAKETIEKFRTFMSTFGLIELLVTDNGSQFTSYEFTQFLAKNGIKFLTSPVGHPSSNGQAENLVKSFKNSLIKNTRDSSNKGVSFQTLLSRFLFSYRNSNHMTTGVTPASLMLKFQPKTRLDILRSSETLFKKDKSNEGKSVKSFEMGEIVYCRDLRNPNKESWAKARIDELIGDSVYFCKLLTENLVWKRHADQIIKYSEQIVEDSEVIPDKITPRENNNELLENIFVRQELVKEKTLLVDTKESEVDSNGNSSNIILYDEQCVTDNKVQNNVSENIVCRMNLRPRHNIKPPDKLNL